MDDFLDASKLLGPVIYALTRQGEVIYVGKAKNGLTRLYTHQYNRLRHAKGKKLLYGKPMEFDGIKVWPCAVEELDAREALIINQFKPRLNTNLRVPGTIKQPIVLAIGRTRIVLNKAPTSAPVDFVRRI